MAMFVARQAQIWRRIAPASSPSPMRTSSVTGGFAAPGLGEAELGMQAGALEKSAARLARNVNEPLGAHERGAEALHHRQERLGEQRRRIAVGDRRQLTVVVRPVRGRARPAGRTSSSQGQSSAVARRWAEAGALGGRVAARELAVQRHHRVGRGEIQLGEHDSIGRLDLRARLLVARELPGTRLGVDGADDARGERRRRSPQASSPSRIDQGSAIPVVSSTTTSGCARRATSAIAAHSSDCTRTSWHTQPPASSITSPARLLMRRRVDVDAAELVDDHADPPPVLRPQHPVQERRLARAQKAGEQDQRRFGDGVAADTARDCSARERSILVGDVAPRRAPAPLPAGAPAGERPGTQARTPAAISGVGRSRLTAHASSRSASSARGRSSARAGTG